VTTNGSVSIKNAGLPELSDMSGICFGSANNLFFTGAIGTTAINPGATLAATGLASTAE
jgi:hypothetical protein